MGDTCMSSTGNYPPIGTDRVFFPAYIFWCTMFDHLYGQGIQKGEARLMHHAR